MNQLNRQNCQEVDEEPTFKILSGNRFSFHDEQTVLVIVRCVECQDDIDEEARVHKVVENKQTSRRIVDERDLIGHPKGRVQQQNHNVDVPYRHVYVVRFYQVVCLIT